MTKKKVAILIVNYNGINFLPRCLQSVYGTVEEDVDKSLYIVDNLSTDGSPDFIAENYPQANLIFSSHNSGFAGGNNLGWDRIRATDADYLFLLNQDAQLTDNCLSGLVRFMEEHEAVAACQPKIMLWPETSRINSLGTVIHYLGFGYSSFEGHADRPDFTRPQPINYASGAALLIRRTALTELGKLFEEFMFMYLEDLDLGWRLWLQGWQSYVVPQSVVYHEYEFKRSIRQVYFFERNRLYIVWKNYKLLTLLLLLPAGLFMEIGQLFFALKNKSILNKLRGYGWFLNPINFGYLIKERIAIQRQRVVPDSFLLKQFSGIIDFQPLKHPLLQYIANPTLSLYLTILRLLVRW